MSKLKYQFIWDLNIKKKDTQDRIKLINNFYKYILNNVLESNINDIINSTNLYLVKQIISIIQSLFILKPDIIQCNINGIVNSTNLYLVKQIISIPQL